MPCLDEFPVRCAPAGNAYMEMGMEVQLLPPDMHHADNHGFLAHEPPVGAERDGGIPYSDGCRNQ